MKEELNEILDRKITQHDRHQFEIKFDVNLTPDTKCSEYKVELFFFIPKSLGINNKTYSKNDFYLDIQNYLRFKTPHIAITKIFSPENTVSPYNRVKNNLAAFKPGQNNNELASNTISELKLLGCIIKSNIRDDVKAIIDGNIDSTSLISEFVNTLIKNVITNIRGLEAGFDSAVIPSRVVESYFFLDEFVSLTVESYMTVLMQYLDKKKIFLELMPEIGNIIKNEILRRKNRKYQSLLSHDTENESYGYRKGILKKFISSILFLKMEERKEKGIHELLFGIAAGIAMLLAVLLGVFLQARFATDSIVFVSAVVIGYVFKDRLKDWLKVYFSAQMSQWLFDSKINILDPLKNNNIIGVFKEAFIFPILKHIPADVIKMRHLDNITSVDEEGKPEEIMKYGKRVNFYNRKILGVHHRLTSLNDIIRFNISRFLYRADDSKYNQQYYNIETGKFDSVLCSKVYHINIILRYTFFTKSGQTIKLEKVRLIANRDGIQKIEM